MAVTPTAVYKTSPLPTAAGATSASVSITTAVGDLILVFASTDGGSTTITSPSGGSLTYSAVSGATQTNLTSHVNTYWWSTTATAASSFSVSVTFTGFTSGDAGALAVYRYPTGTALGNVTSAISSSAGAPSLSLTTAHANSSIIWGSTDYNGVPATGTTWITSAQTPTVDNATSSSGILSVWLARYEDVGAVGSKSLGMTAPTGQIWTATALEVYSTGPTLSGTLATSGSGTTSFSATTVGEKGTLSTSGSGSLGLTGIASSTILTGSGTTVFAGTPAEKGTLTVSGSGTLSWNLVKVTAQGVDPITGVGTVVFSGKPGLPGSLAVSGLGTLVFAFVGSTSIIQTWNGTQWKNAPLFTWTGTLWKTGNLSVIHSLGNTTHGMYAGAGTAGVSAFNTVKGTNITLGADQADFTTWQTLTSTANLSAWSTWCGVSAARRLVYSVGLLTLNDDPGLTVAQRYLNLAYGLYDTYFSAIATALYAYPSLRDTTIRLGERMNHAGLPWSVPSGDQDTLVLYQYAYNRIAAIMRQACPQLTFEWCPNLGLDSTKRTLADLYPGDAFVDYVGISFGDAEPGGTGAGDTETNRFALLTGQVNGLTGQVALGAAHGKRVVASNWGLVPTSDSSHGGGDDPAFIDSVLAWFATNSYAYSVYNNSSTLTGVDSRLSSYPTAQAEYVAKFLAIGG